MTSVIGVDAGNSKTDVALVLLDGTVGALVRGGGSSPHGHGLAASIEIIRELCGQALAEAGEERQPDAAALFVAGVDQEDERLDFAKALEARPLAERIEVANDTFAVLRAGASDGVGVGVVCGAGMNAVAVSPDGETVRFGALGALTGDWGGGADLGTGALGAAVRCEDGRGPETSLVRAVPAHFGLESALAVAIAVHRERIARERLVELAPLVLSAAREGDVAAISLIERQAGEIDSLAATASRRAFGDQAHRIVLGGGLLSPRSELTDRVAKALSKSVPSARVLACDVPPIAGAAAAALELAGAAPQAALIARERLRELDAGRRVMASTGGER